MAQPPRRHSVVEGVSIVVSAWHNPFARILNVDLLAVLLAFLLPWKARFLPALPVNCWP